MPHGRIFHNNTCLIAIAKIVLMVITVKHVKVSAVNAQLIPNVMLALMVQGHVYASQDFTVQTAQINALLIHTAERTKCVKMENVSAKKITSVRSVKHSVQDLQHAEVMDHAVMPAYAYAMNHIRATIANNIKMKRT